VHGFAGGVVQTAGETPATRLVRRFSKLAVFGLSAMLARITGGKSNRLMTRRNAMLVV
jgi:hypothetical protein